jgi:Tol biopolymer transport system component
MNPIGIRLSFALVALAALVGSVAAPPAAASPRWSDWSAPVWLGATVNSTGDEFGPAVSKDGRALYFASTRSGGEGGQDLWVSYRASTSGAWGPPQNLGPVINTGTTESGPALSRDGHWLFFGALSRPGGSGLFDLWASYRLHTHEDFGEFGWQTPTPLTALNTPFGENLPNYFQDEETNTAFLFFESNRPGGLGLLDIYVAVQQPDGSFGAATNVTALNSPQFERRPTISHDGLEIIFSSDRAGSNGLLDLWTATRESTAGEWSTPSNIAEVNSSFSDSGPYFSADRQTLYFTSTRSGGLGGTTSGDIWMSTRTKETGKP